jgi:hypothetical protein
MYNIERELPPVRWTLPLFFPSSSYWGRAQPRLVFPSNQEGVLLVYWLLLATSLSTSATLWVKICCSTLGFSSSLVTFAMMLSASSFCSRCLTWPS